MELYILKSSITLTTLYLFYWIFLRKETYHSWNRIYLMTSVIVSLIFPFFSYNLQQVSVNNFATLLEPIIIKGEYNPAILVSTTKEFNILSIIYISGALFFALRFISSIAKIQWLFFRFPRVNYMGFKAVLLGGDQSPFTFFNVLFISRKDYEKGKIDEMIVHETAHKNHGHSVDVIMLEIFTILQWFNPVIWLLRQSLKLEHEYIADEAVLKKGFNVAGYQKMLFEKSLGITSFELTNNFNYSLLKKRLKMMTIHKTNIWNRLKYVLSIPALLVIILLLAVNINSSAQKEEIVLRPDVQANFKNGGMEGLREFLKKNLVYPQSTKNKKLSAKIYMQFVVNDKGKVNNLQILKSEVTDAKGRVWKITGNTDVNSKVDKTALDDFNAEAIRVGKMITDFTPAQKDGKNVGTQIVLPVQFQQSK